MQNLQNTKKKLTLFFVGVVFLIIFIFSISSIFTKYIGLYKKDEKDFLNFMTIINGSEENTRDFMENRYIYQKIKNSIKKVNQKSKIHNILSKGNYINTIFIRKGEIKFLDIKENISEKLLTNIIEKNIYFNIQIDDGFFIKKTKIKNGENIFFKKLKYNFSDFLADIILFLIIDLLFCIIIYFIGIKFINKVFQPMEENINDMKNFVHNAGHELKTPISVIDSDIQLLLDIKKYDKNMILEMKKELKNMNSLINSLIKISDIGNFKKTENNNLSDIIEEILKHNSKDIKEKNLEININISKEILVKANANYLQIFLSNIIKNAIKYNKKYGKIDIFYKKGILKVIDTGIGISEIDKEKIFDRFFKADRSRNSEGFGIGLSLVKKIANIYSWKISVKSEEKKGSEFEIRF